jgi:hypothetical protein
MTLRPTRLPLALVAAAALALGSLAPAPARADADLQRFLAAAAGLVILYGVLDAGRRTQAAPPPVVHTPPHHGHRPPQHVHRPPHGHPPYRGRPHPAPAPIALPSRCAVEVRGRGQPVRNLYGERCLQQAGIDLRRLPRQCLVTLRSDRGTRLAYDGACLRSASARPGHGSARLW